MTAPRIPLTSAGYRELAFSKSVLVERGLLGSWTPENIERMTYDTRTDSIYFEPLGWVRVNREGTASKEILNRAGLDDSDIVEGLAN